MDLDLRHADGVLDARVGRAKRCKAREEGTERARDEAEAALEAAAEAAAAQDLNAEGYGATSPGAEDGSRVRELKLRVERMHAEQEDLLVCVAEQDEELEKLRDELGVRESLGVRMSLSGVALNGGH